MTFKIRHDFLTSFWYFHEFSFTPYAISLFFTLIRFATLLLLRFHYWHFDIIIFIITLIDTPLFHISLFSLFDYYFHYFAIERFFSIALYLRYFIDYYFIFIIFRLFSYCRYYWFSSWLPLLMILSWFSYIYYILHYWYIPYRLHLYIID
jgi:hypothetical protein